MRKLCTSTPFSRKLRVYQAQHKSDTLGQFKPLILYLFLSHNTGLQNLTNTTEKKRHPLINAHAETICCASVKIPIHAAALNRVNAEVSLIR